MSRRPIRSLAVLLGASLALGCAGRAHPPVTRVLDGARRTAPFVPPSGYEAFVRAELALAAGALAEAEAGYRAALREAPADVLLLARLAETLGRRGERSAAERVLRRALAIDPDAEAAWLTRGRLAELDGDTDRAIAAYARALWVAPGSGEPLLALAAVLAEAGEEGRAEALLLQRADSDGAGGVHAARAALALASRRGDPTTAERAARALLAQAPSRRDELLRAARAALEGGRPRVAAGLLDAIPSAPDDAALRARAYDEAGRPEEAAAARERASTPPSEGDTSMPARRLRAGEDALARGDDVEGARQLAAVPPGSGPHARARAALVTALGEAGLGAVACELLDGPGAPSERRAAPLPCAAVEAQ